MNRQNTDLPVVIIGAGPAGLMAAEVLVQAGYQVEVYEQKPSAARKFLMAGKTGLNISHNEPFDDFVQRYDKPDWLRPMLQHCDAAWIQQWMQRLGVTSYVGSSGRIFPVEMKAAPLLRAWLQALKQQGVQFFYRHRWIGWDSLNGSRLDQNHAGQLQFMHQEKLREEHLIKVSACAVILATGGGSWARLGSDGAWIDLLKQRGVAIVPLQPSNVGIEVGWSNFMQAVAGQPLKRINAWVQAEQILHGEAVISHYGLEGGLIYRLSRALREQFENQHSVILYLDLLPAVSQKDLEKKLQPSAKQSMNNIWRKAGLDTTKVALLREIVAKTEWQNAQNMATMAKRLPIKINGFRPIDEAISTAGGVTQIALTPQLMLREQMGVFCCGEMLDWDAPTGGYLLTACFATGRQAAYGVIDWLESQQANWPKSD